ncbi:ABC transporter ATP-binding protein [Jannaschia sp. EhC01]|uniref:ABC transporter ATP-binding protein n=1 Tax=Gymnodinialimonas phycosphaerae TaxID=2841589 RepID=A0A975YG80_9RHOB|nr:ABC transporter ATP-binding protein [Gymnodinialimonas phycosphaerae]MBY4891384.1 ABC transporter ATP-binding protein [Gymnodinialimonas phycosphaerae]OAN71276.1 ABC transporter ATP-binding protein [Jannaschia sp. EhC01]
MIDLSGITFSYPGGDFRLSVPDLTLADGERVAVVGPSGTGKTTLLNLIAGIAVPQAGRITIDGKEITGLSDSARRTFRANNIGFIFQDFALLDYLTARENILYPYRITAGAPLDAEARARAEQLAKACGLEGKLGRRPGALSQGEQQRVALCRALVRQPKLILADEATGNLDPDNKVAILDLLFSRTREAGAALLAVTHDHDLLPRFDRVIDFADFRVATEAGA